MTTLVTVASVNELPEAVRKVHEELAKRTDAQGNVIFDSDVTLIEVKDASPNNRKTVSAPASVPAPVPAPVPVPPAAPAAATSPADDDSTSNEEVELTLDPQQQEAYDDIMAGKSLMLSGAGGMGKSEILKRTARDKIAAGQRIAITAMTGPAAFLIRGQTLHSLLRLPPKELDEFSAEDLFRIADKEEVIEALGPLDTLYVDEVSMMRDRMLEILEVIATRARATYRRQLQEEENSDEEEERKKKTSRKKATRPAGETEGDDDDSKEGSKKTNRKRRFEEDTAKFGRPCGGLQIVLSGDFYQLAPVVRGSALVGYAFQSPLWKQIIEVVHDLKVSYRQQKDQAFSEMLLRIRKGEVTKADQKMLRSRLHAKLNLPPGIQPTKLESKKERVQAYNLAELAKLEGPEHGFKAVESHIIRSAAAKGGAKTFKRYYGALDKKQAALLHDLKQTMPVPELLRLKVGAQVRLVKNLDQKMGLVNGARGVVVEIGQFKGQLTPRIQFAALPDKKVWIGPDLFRKEDPTSDIQVGVSQIPLALAWATTVHGAQGATLDAGELPLDRSLFAYGMAYVVLSRFRSLDSFTLTSLDTSCVRADPVVKKFYDGLNETPDELSSPPPPTKKQKLDADGNPIKKKKKSGHSRRQVTVEMRAESSSDKKPAKASIEFTGFGAAAPRSSIPSAKSFQKMPPPAVF